MKLSLPVKLATAAFIALSSLGININSSMAEEFDELAVEQDKFIAVAIPFNYRRFRLAIIEQVPGEKTCWRESIGYPTTVDLLLLNFDHTQSCRKAVDTNGYSLKVNDREDEYTYTLNLVQKNNELQLIADHQDPSQPDLVVGKTNGIQEAPLKITLDPKWQFTKRLYEGDAIQHIYLSNNPNPQVIPDVAVLPTTNDPDNPKQPTPNPSNAATQPPSTTTATIDPNAVEGLMELLQPLADAVYETYNSLFTAPAANNSQPTPAVPFDRGDGEAK
jgi:hypothetical protein